MRKMLFLSVFSAFFLITGYSQVQQLGDPFFGENEYDYFGAGVAVSDDGNIVAFSSLGYDSFQENAGLVRVYSYNNGWVQLGSDINPGFGSHSFPGVSLEISGDGSVVIIEDTYNRWVAFKFNNNEWIQIGERYSPSNLESNSKGNLSANYDGTLVAYGSPSYNNNQGRVVLFSYEDDQWNILDEIYGPNAGANEMQRFGTSVYLNESGSRLAVTTRSNNYYDDFVSVYEFDEGSWNLLGENLYHEPYPALSGAHSISLNNEGNILAVGYPQGPSESCGVCGTVSIYQYDGSNWNMMGDKIYSETGSNTGQQDEYYYQYLGYNVSLNGEGNFIAISSNAPSMYNNNDLSGMIRLYSFLENEWVNVTDIIGEWGIHLIQDTPGNFTNSGHHGIGGSLDLSKNGETLITGASDNSQLDINKAGMVTIKGINPCIITPFSVNAPDPVSFSTNDGCTVTEFSLGSATIIGNCSEVSISNDAPTAFEVGETIVTWTVTDDSGNTSTDTQQVIVIDESSPTAICNDITLILENGIAEISSEDIDNGSFDECGGDINLSISQSSFNESHIGGNTVVLTVSDQYGNSSTCQSTVTIEVGMGIDEDNLANIIISPNPTTNYVYLNSSTELEALVYDLLGKQVMREFITDKLDISCLEKGTYIINLTDGASTSSHKIIKN